MSALTQKLNLWIQRQWYSQKPVAWHLLSWPLEQLFKSMSVKQKNKDLAQAKGPNVPVIILGNIHVGGMGKSPVVQALARHYAANGLKVGVLLRGYKSKQQNQWPHILSDNSSTDDAGDEAVMHYAVFQQESINALVAVDPVRTRGADALVTSGVDLIICDDGLQHYKLKRDCEIVMYQPARGIGRGFLLPRGPLREPVERLDTVDFVLSTAAIPDSIHQKCPSLAKKLWLYRTQMEHPVNLISGQQLSQNMTDVLALAAIADPSAFFKRLQKQGFQLSEHYAYADHQHFTEQHLKIWFAQRKPVLMTMKDAVKIKALLPSLSDELQQNVAQYCFLIPYKAILEPFFVEKALKVAQTRFKTRQEGANSA